MALLTDITTVQAETPEMLPTGAAGFQNETQYRTYWGIDNLLTDFIIQNEEITEDRITDQTQGQKGEMVAELDYDKHWTLVLNVIGGGNDTTKFPVIGSGTQTYKPGDLNFSYNSHVWKVKSIIYAGAYNDKKKYTINAERWANFPPQS